MSRSTTAFAAALVASAVIASAATAADIESTFVTSGDGTRIHVLADGEEALAAVLFVPGWTMSAEIWRPQMEHLAGRYRVVAMDPRGQGESDKPAEGLYPAGRARDLTRGQGPGGGKQSLARHLRGLIGSPP